MFFGPTKRIMAPLWPELELSRQLRARTLPGETFAERRARLDAARDMREVNFW